MIKKVLWNEILENKIWLRKPKNRISLQILQRICPFILQNKPGLNNRSIHTKNMLSNDRIHSKNLL